MRILHTADWHLGKKLDNFSRIEEQINVMEEIVNIANEQNVDLVIVAGDLFDNFNPSVEAIDLFYKTLKRLSNNGNRPVIAIAGNHDAPSLIDAPDPLAKACGIILIGKPNAVVTKFKFEHFEIVNSDNGFIEIKLPHIPFPIRILHTAFANEQRLKEYLGDDKESQLNEILFKNWNYLANKYCDNNGVNLLTTHLYMNKKGSELIEEPDGEKPLKIGNADMIYTESIPNSIQYTALGHIHGFRNIGTIKKPIVYASSPIAYSFSEAGQAKYVIIVNLEPNVDAAFEKIALNAGRPLYRKQFDNVDIAVEWLKNNPNTLVELTIISDAFLTANERKALYQSHDGIIHLIPIVNAATQTINSNFETINLNQNIDELFVDYFKSKNKGQAPNEEIIKLFNEIKNQ